MMSTVRQTRTLSTGGTLFTPYHMGPGALLKALLRGGFSLMIFGWTQILMDLQPLVVLAIGRGQLHGISHTYVGGTFIALLAAVSGKYLVQWVLRLRPRKSAALSVSWVVAVLSALIGSCTHVAFDSLVHADVSPFWPFSQTNPAIGLVSASTVWYGYMVSGLVGVALYLIVGYLLAGRHAATSPLDQSLD